MTVRGMSAGWLSLVLLAWVGGGAGVQAGNLPEVWLVYERNGIDSAGRSGLKRVEILPNGHVTWEAASIGRVLPGGCAPGGGTLEGRIGPEAALAVANRARAVLKSQPSLPPGEVPLLKPRSLRQSLEVTIGESTEAGTVSLATPAFEAFEKELSGLYAELSPSGAVALSAKRVRPDQLRVRFVAPGARGSTLAFPANAAEVFSLSGFELGYAGPPPPVEVKLGEKVPIFEVSLRLKPLAGSNALLASSLLRFSTATVAHHVEGKGEVVKPSTHPLNLCAEVR